MLEDAGPLVGLVVLKEGPEALLVPNVAGPPAAQGRGHGRRLLEFAVAEAERRSSREVRLVVNALMAENIALYRHLGFTEIGRIQGTEADRAYIVMAKPIAWRRRPHGRQQHARSTRHGASSTGSLPNLIASVVRLTPVEAAAVGAEATHRARATIIFPHAHQGRPFRPMY